MAIHRELRHIIQIELKAEMFEDRANGYAIGDYKKRNNTVNGLVVANPMEVFFSRNV